MSFSEFIRRNMTSLATEWETFVRTQFPTAPDLDLAPLRDSAGEFLDAIATDMENSRSEDRSQSNVEPFRLPHAPRLVAYGRKHAAMRLSQDFTIGALTTEFRALRAIVQRRWAADARSAEDVHELIRFNEAVDEALAECLDVYGFHVGNTRELCLGMLERDLREPLTTIETAAQALLQEPTLSKGAGGTIVRLQETSRRMQQMLQDLLDYTRTRLGADLPLNVVHRDLSPIIASAVEDLRAAHPRQQVLLQCHERLMGDWDAQRLTQMLSYVLSNAVQHGERDSPVSVHAIEEGNEIRLTIHNEGVPIPPEMLDAIFEPMMRSAVCRLKQSHFAGSVGVGLYISNQIVKAHRGHMAVVSDNDRGTTFTAILPATANASVVNSAFVAPPSDAARARAYG